MFHNILMTTLTPQRDTNENHCWGNRAFTTGCPVIWPELKQEKLKDTNIKKTIKKKKRNRTMFTTEQVKVLDKVFARSKYIDAERRREIAECLQIEQKSIKIWFQNRRMKQKKDLSEVCDSASEGVVESQSPPLQYSQPSNSVSYNRYTPTFMHSHGRPSQHYYSAPDNYIKPEIHQQGEPSGYEAASNSAITEYFNNNNHFINTNGFLINNTEFSAQYYPPQIDYQYYYNSEINNQNIRSDVQDWPVNIFDTSYL